MCAINLLETQFKEARVGDKGREGESIQQGTVWGAATGLSQKLYNKNLWITYRRMEETWFTCICLPLDKDSQHRHQVESLVISLRQSMARWVCVKPGSAEQQQKNKQTNRKTWRNAKRHLIQSLVWSVSATLQIFKTQDKTKIQQWMLLKRNKC